MDESIRCLRFVAVFIGSWLAVQLGGMDSLLVLLLVLFVIDILTGVMWSLIAKVTSSKVMVTGIAKKACELLIVVVCVYIDATIYGYFNFNLHSREFFLVFILLDELLSIVENACKMGIFPIAFRDRFIQVKEEFVVSLGTAVLSIFKSVKDIVIKALTANN